jgi:GNAT superfamily N-acetyltransferase
MRGKGIGRKLWNAMLETAGNKIVGLDSVSEMREWYKKQGLVYEGGIYCKLLQRKDIQC